MPKVKIALAAFGWLSPVDSGGGILGWHLANKLHELGYLDKLIIFSKNKTQTTYCCIEPVPRLTYLYYFARLSRIPGYITRGVSERLCDLFAQRLIRKDRADVLIVSHPVFPRTLRKARRLGITTILLALNPLDSTVENIVLKEQDVWDVTHEDGYTTPFRLNEMKASYAQIDYVLAATSVIGETYRHPSWTHGRIIDLSFPVGPNLALFKEPVRKTDNLFRVSFLAQTVLLKGLQYLVQAWKGINLPNAELVIGGELQASMIKLIRERFVGLKNVTFTGHLQDINVFLKNSSVFVCPSLIDGGPRTVYEAMACAVPVIVSDGCGAKDIITDGVEGFVVPAKDPQAIAAKIRWLYGHQDEAKQMGLRAQQKISTYTIEKFADRVVQTLEKNRLLSQKC